MSELNSKDQESDRSEDELLNPSTEHRQSGATLPTRKPETRKIFDMWRRAGVPVDVILGHLAPSIDIPDGTEESTLWRLLLSILEPPPRKRLTQYNTIEDAVELIKKSKKIMVLSGAGISTSAGIPDFRSRDGIYVQIHAEHPDLEDPKLMFEISYFSRNPRPFFRFARALYPGQFEPTIGHKFIKCIEDHDKLLRNYSQNIDTLEKQANITRVIECHGSFAKATCTNCGYCVDGEDIKSEVMEQRVPMCPKCYEAEGEMNSQTDLMPLANGKYAVMKPNIVFFGEQLGDHFHRSLDSDRDAADLLIVIGSSLKVRPVAQIPMAISEDVPQILINKEHLDNFVFDIELLGNCDEIIQELCLRLGDDWSKICKPDTVPMRELKSIPTKEIKNESNQSRNETPAPSEEKKRKVEEPQESSSSLRKEEIEHDPSEKKENNKVDCDETKPNEEVPEIEDSDDNDWDDIEIIQDPDPNKIAPVEIESGTYVQAKPGMYLFHGSELTNRQYKSLTKNTSPESSHQSSLDDSP